MFKPINVYEGSSSALSKWDDAGDALANALATYLRSCSFLETFSPNNAVDTQHLATRIDFSLNTLHTKLSKELAQSRAILTRMRNKAFSRFHSIPNEIISAIFMEVVYAPAPDDDPADSMGGTLKIIFGRLYKLLSVCSFWRKMAESLKELWSIIPITAGCSGYSTHTITSFILERSQASLSSNRPLYLAATLSPGIDPHLPLVDGKAPRFTSINIESPFSYKISQLLDSLLLHSGSLQAISELSIRQISYKDPYEGHTIPSRSQYLTDGMPANSHLFTDLVGSVSVLRIRGVYISWDKVTFSKKLVEICLQSVALGYNSKLTGFLDVLQSASELRDLKIISVVAFPDAPAFTKSPVKTIFPKLRSLLLEDLDFNVLRTVLGSICAGSHRVTLFLTPQSQRIYQPNEEPTRVDIQHIYELLKHSTVDTLLLNRDFEDTMWLDHMELHRILHSLPSLKTLKMAHWQFKKKDLQALERPQSSSFCSSTVAFPSLETLCFIGSYIRHTEALYGVATSHPLHTMELGGNIPVMYSDDEDEDTRDEEDMSWGHITDDDPIVRRLEAIVPGFRLVNSTLGIKDFNRNVWQLW
ncbi:unnamed protein product [Rhizoctonia solani]|uniref:F-box domain-containing protein n=1 Tax=Rhizoctonia solani TaxID=456999 RepID=A0A8H3HE37_9AGAM|nr:unnamed protein product [Rhizoctonia solani]CAE6501452.1 unnamed protein product [Rhizoctonia solani]